MGRIADCHVLLHRNALVPWFILVPETDVHDLLDLPAERRNNLMEMCAAISRFLRAHWNVPKINFGAIGNVVPQLHLHVVGRSPGDACWPRPVWGNLTERREYTTQELEQISHALANCFTDLLDGEPPTANALNH